MTVGAEAGARVLNGARTGGAPGDFCLRWTGEVQGRGVADMGRDPASTSY